MALRKFSEIEPPREPLITEKGEAYIRKVASDPKLARQFLIDAGIIDENGELTPPYRPEE